MIGVIKWLLLGLLALLLLLLVLPVSLHFRYENSQLKLELRVLFMRFDLAHESKKSTPNADGEEGGAQRSLLERLKDKLRRKTSAESGGKSDVGIDMLLELLSPVGGLLRSLLRSIRIVGVRIRLVSGGGFEPETIGANTGYIWAALGNAAAMLENLFRVRIDELTVIPDFSSEHSGETLLAATVRAVPAAIFAAAALFAVRFLRAKRNTYQKVREETPA